KSTRRRSGFMIRPTVFAAVVFLLASAVGAETPLGTAFTYQGRLTDGGGPASGVYDLQFTLFSAETEGTQVGPILTSAGRVVTDGLFPVPLDFGSSAFAGNARWLEIAVRPGSGGAFTSLAPRQALTATPNALWSRTAASATTVSGLVPVANGGTGTSLTTTGRPGRKGTETNCGPPSTLGRTPPAAPPGVVGVA